MSLTAHQLWRERAIWLLDALTDATRELRESGELDAVLAHLDKHPSVRAGRNPDPGQKWKCGDEFLPFHPQASHVPADYRDGWNRCYWMAVGRSGDGGEKG